MAWLVDSDMEWSEQAQKNDAVATHVPRSLFRIGERRRSVRTTFNLSESAVEKKEWLSSYYGMSQKDVLDIALELVEECFEQDGEGLLKKLEMLKSEIEEEIEHGEIRAS